MGLHEKLKRLLDSANDADDAAAEAEAEATAEAEKAAQTAKDAADAADAKRQAAAQKRAEADSMKRQAAALEAALVCGHCANAWLVRLERVGTDGNSKPADYDLFFCPACERAWRTAEAEDGTVKLVLAAASRSIQTWRAL